MNQPQTQFDARTLPVGYELHWYTIKEVLGKGGFGVTYLCRDNNLDKDFAIKEFLPMEIARRNEDYTIHATRDDVTERLQWGLDRFIKEARTLSKFDHPNIVRVHSVFEANNTAYMVMSYEQGMSFLERLREGEQPDEEELLNIILPLLDGLDVMHADGFIHRDIKPGNIFVRKNGSPVLLDFGSAREAMNDETMTLTMMVSPGYAPIEQYYGKSDVQGPWTDIYSLGATIYRSITGDPPTDSTFRNRLTPEQSKEEMWHTLNKHSDKYSVVFLRAIEHALRQNFKERPQTVDDWRSMFTDPNPSTETQWRMHHESKDIKTKPKPQIRKSWRLPLVLILVILAVAVAMVYYFND